MTILEFDTMNHLNSRFLMACSFGSCQFKKLSIESDEESRTKVCARGPYASET